VIDCDDESDEYPDCNGNENVTSALEIATERNEDIITQPFGRESKGIDVERGGCIRMQTKIKNSQVMNSGGAFIVCFFCLLIAFF